MKGVHTAYSLHAFFPDWREYPEPQWDGEAAARARRWIAKHPVEFAKQVPRRQIAYLCCCDDNIYDLMLLGLEIGDWRYKTAMAVAAAAWMAVLTLVLLAAARAAGRVLRNRDALADPRVTAYLLLVPPILVSLALHSMGESGNRFGFTFHIFWAVLASALADWRGVGDRTPANP